eukprot:5199722-Pleurochrysis_carterae.AAC.1
MEACFLQMLDYDVNVDISIFAKYYFALHDVRRRDAATNTSMLLIRTRTHTHAHERAHTCTPALAHTPPR